MSKGNLTWSGIICAALLTAATTLIISGCVKNVPSDKAATATSGQQPVAVPAVVSTELQNTDCIKCHKTEPADIKKAGGRHKTEVACQDCHQEHPPWGENTIPQCSKCHDPGDQEHFALTNCLKCHKNPHTPLNISIEDSPESVKVCLTCHTDKGEEFKAFPSKHAQQNCTLCHPDRHKVINKCFTCHEGHSKSMTYENCLGCHQPHSPKNITYKSDTPSAFCGACHEDVYKNLTSNPSKHQKLTCAFCHKDKHPTVPKCADCHAAPHDQKLLSTFPDCLKCHIDPHNLSI